MNHIDKEFARSRKQFADDKKLDNNFPKIWKLFESDSDFVKKLKNRIQTIEESKVPKELDFEDGTLYSVIKIRYWPGGHRVEIDLEVRH